MTLLALDIGSSSVKTAILRGTRVVGAVARQSFVTNYDAGRAEVDPNAIVLAVARAVKTLGRAAKSVDAIALSVMAPAWLAMDKHGRPITPIVTHQDRRSVEIAHALEKRIG